jgi:phosphoglycolate phosphatase
LTYRLVIFDFDGTLADSQPWFESVLNDVGERYGFRRIEESEREHLRRLDARQFIAHLGVPRWKVPFIARHMRILKAANLGAIPLFAGIGALLRDLSDGGIRLAMVSSDTEANIRQVLGPEISALFGHYACSASLLGKPRKFRRVLREAGIPAGEALAIGDEIRDAQAARASGIDFAAVGWGYAAPDALAPHAVTVFGEPRDIGTFCRSVPTGALRAQRPASEASA